MKVHAFIRIALGYLAFGLMSSTVFAQKFEIHPYAGGFFPGKWADVSKFKSQGLYGLKGGLFLTETIEVEGNFGYINHFDFAGNDTKTRGTLWDMNGSYNFTQRYGGLRPYATFGLGGLTTHTDGPEAVFNERLLVHNHDNFLSVNYGGGVKTLRLWGPMGLRADMRGRTLPRLYGEKISWLEITGGLTFIWGER